MKQTQRHTINSAIFISYALLITALSLKPHIDTGQVPYNDKVAHLLTYCIFTLLAWRVELWRSHMVQIAVGIILYSGFIEIAQHFTGRMLSFYDFVANTVGVVLALAGLSIKTGGKFLRAKKQS